MINYLDNLSHHLFMTLIDELTDETHVSFQQLDEYCHTHVGNLQRNALNVYLVDLRVNR